MRRLRTACRDLLSEQLVEVVRAAFSAIQCAPVAEDLGVELGIGHDFECCVQTRRFVVAHEDRSRTPMFCDGDAFIATRDIVDESAELRLRLGQRQRLHDLTSLQTNSGMRDGAFAIAVSLARRESLRDPDRVVHRESFRATTASRARRFNRHDLDQAGEFSEVVWITRVQGQIRCERGGCDQ